MHAEISALRQALEEGLSISSAISVVSDVIGADSRTLLCALASFRAQDADRAMEVALAVRSVEATIEEVLLPALAEVRRRKGLCSAAWAFSARWAVEWLGRTQRVTPVSPQACGVLIGDAADGGLDPASPYIRALELCCTRAGASVLTLPVAAVTRVAEPIAVIQPEVVVIAGGHAPDDTVARWAYAVRQTSGEVPFVLFHRGLESGVGAARAQTLPLSPVEAQRRVTEMLRDAGGPAPLRLEAVGSG